LRCSYKLHHTCHIMTMIDKITFTFEQFYRSFQQLQNDVLFFSLYRSTTASVNSIYMFFSFFTAIPAYVKSFIIRFINRLWIIRFSEKARNSLWQWWWHKHHSSRFIIISYNVFIVLVNFVNLSSDNIWSFLNIIFCILF